MTTCTRANPAPQAPPAAEVEVWSKPGADRLVTPQFLLLLAIQHAFGFAFSAFFLLPKYLTTELDAGPQAIGQVTAIAMVAGVVVVPFLAPLLDRRRRRPFVLGGSLLMAAAAVGFVWVDAVGPYVMVLRSVQGLAFTMVFSAVVTLVTDLSPPARLGRAIGWCGVAMLVTNAIAPLVMEPLAEQHGWTPAFVFAGGAAVVASGLSLLIREAPPAPREVVPAVSALRSARVGVALVASALAGAAFGAMFTFTQPFALSLGATRVAGFFGGFTVAALVVRISLGGLVDRFGRRRISFVTLLAYTVVVMATAALTPGRLAVFGAAFGVAHGLMYPALSAFSLEGVDRRQRGTVVTYFSGAFNAGVAVSVIVLGLVAEAHGYPPIFIGAGVLSLIAAAALASVR